jgi:hypothetical protein
MFIVLLQARFWANLTPNDGDSVLLISVVLGPASAIPLYLISDVIECADTNKEIIYKIQSGRT